MTAPDVIVGVCTFRRPHRLAGLLSALAQQRFPHEPPNWEVLVVDDDPLGSAAPVVGQAAGSSTTTIRYLAVGSQNIASARNAILDEAMLRGASRVAFVDDDEEPEADWLAGLLAAAARTGAPVTVGDVRARFPPSAPAWMAERELFDQPRHEPDATLHEGLTGNVLIEVELIRRAALRFDEALGRSGGEDQEFFRRARTSGAEIRYAAEAVVHEWVEPERASLRYLLKREYRKGNTLGLLDRRSPLTALVRIVKAMWWLVTGAVVTVGAVARRDLAGRAVGATRTSRAAGMIAGLVGRRYEPYGGQLRGSTVACVLPELTNILHSGQRVHFEGLLDHLSTRFDRVALVVPTGKLDAVMRPGPATEVHAPGAFGLGGTYIVADRRAAMRTAANLVYQHSPHIVRRALDRARTTVRGRAGVDHRLGRTLDEHEQRWLARRLAKLQPDAVFYYSIWSLPQRRDLVTELASGAEYLISVDVMSERADQLRSLGYRVAPHDFDRAAEVDLLKSVPNVVAIQWDDEATFRHLAPHANVMTVPATIAAPAPTAASPATVDGSSGRVLFVGSGSLHNVDGLRWFLDSVWPLVLSRRPDAALDIVGSVGARVPQGSSGSHCHGVVGDVAAFYAGADVVVVPLRGGSGLKVKLVEAFAHGSAVVTTSVGAQGLAALQPPPFALADEAESFAAEVLSLLADGERRHLLRRRAREAAIRFDPEAAYEPLDQDLVARGVLRAPSS